MSLLSKRCEHYGKRAFLKWTWFFLDAKMEAAYPKALIQPSQQLRKGRVLRSIGQPFLSFDPPVVVTLRCGPKISEFYGTSINKYVIFRIFYGPLA